MIIEDPVTKERYSVPDNYDNDEIIVLNSSNRISQRVFQDMIPNDQLSRSGYNWNRRSTRIDEARAVTVKLTGKPTFLDSGERRRRGRIAKTNW